MSPHESAKVAIGMILQRAEEEAVQARLGRPSPAEVTLDWMLSEAPYVLDALVEVAVERDRRRDTIRTGAFWGMTIIAALEYVALLYLLAR